MDILLENSANPKIEDINSRTPLHYAAQYCDGCPHVVELLLKRYISIVTHPVVVEVVLVLCLLLHIVFLKYFTSL